MACWRPSEGRRFFLFVSASTTAAFGFVCCSLGLCLPATVTVLSITLQHYVCVNLWYKTCVILNMYCNGYCRRSRFPVVSAMATLYRIQLKQNMSLKVFLPMEELDPDGQFSASLFELNLFLYSRDFGANHWSLFCSAGSMLHLFRPNWKFAIFFRIFVLIVELSAISDAHSGDVVFMDKLYLTLQEGAGQWYHAEACMWKSETTASSPGFFIFYFSLGKSLLFYFSIAFSCC